MLPARAPLEEALARYVHHLRKLATAAGAPDKFRATMTWAYVVLLDDAMARSPDASSGPVDPSWLASVLNRLPDEIPDALRARLAELDRRIKAATFRDPGRTLDNFEFDFNRKIDRTLVFELATARFVERHEDVLFLGPPGTGRSHLAQAIGFAAIKQGHKVLYREAHLLLEELADAVLEGTKKETIEQLATAPLLIIDDLGMRKLPQTAAEDLLEVIMRRYEKTSAILTSNRLSRLGQAALRRRRGDRDARPAAPSCTRPQVRPAELADQNPDDPNRRAHRCTELAAAPA